MPKQIIIAEQHQIAAVFSEDQIQELVVSTGTQQVSDIYVGTVENVLPGIDAAFVNIGDSERNGFMHVTDLGPLRLRRSAAAITELLAPQQKVLVQVMKEPTGNKGPRLTGNISLPGRFLVLIPYGRGVNLSRRIESEAERSRLRALAVLIKPAGMGILVRTEAEGKDEDAIIEDLDYLLKQWESIQIQANSARPPVLLNRDDDFIQRVLRDIYTADVNRIVVDSASAVKRVKQHLMNWSGGKSPEGVLIDHHRDPERTHRLPILDFFRVNAAIREALKPRVDLPSGGYIIIEPTEALTVIDVNSGSFTRSATSRETVLWTNYEAATEIARQMRLRNVAGVIVVDFIDMDSRHDQLALLEHFTKALAADKARPQIAQLSELGLVELTRKRQGQNLYELFGEECPHCGGLGHLARLPGETDNSPLERLTPTVSATPTTVSKTPRILERKEEEPELSFEPEESPTPLDLINHPSYQDPGGNNNRRRRRRRLGESETTPNTTPNTTPSTITTSTTTTTTGKHKPRLSSRNGELEKEPNGAAIVERSTPKDEPEAIASQRTDKLRTSPEADSREPIRAADSPPLGSRRIARREHTPMEKITVSMTPLEQELYALMGISPLVRVEGEVKDPKSVLVSVTDTTATGVEDVENVENVENVGNVGIVEIIKGVEETLTTEPTPIPTPVKVVEKEVPPEVQPETPPEPKLVLADPEPANPEPAGSTPKPQKKISEPEAIDVTASRRRRRRSSAQSS